MKKPIITDSVCNPYIDENLCISDNFYKLILACDLEIDKNSHIENVIKILKNAGWVSSDNLAHKKLKNDLSTDKANLIVDICINKFYLNKSHQPITDDYDLLLILGCDLQGMISRLNYYVEIILHNKKLRELPVFILTGTRSTDESFGETLENFTKLCKDQDLDYLPRNELEIIHFLMRTKYSVIKDYTTVNDDVSTHAVQQTSNHATTASTMHKFLDGYLKLDQIHKVLAISNQPYIVYQQAVLTNVIAERGYDFKVETVGYQSNYDSNIKYHALELLDTIIKTIDNNYRTSLIADR